MIPIVESSVTDPQDPPPNPFAIRGLGRRAKGALLPWTHPHHEDLYLPVDHTLEAYQEFTEYLSDPLADLTSKGRLVVVTGDSGCGKTSLIHRCVHHIMKSTPTLGIQAIVDLTTFEPLGPHGELAQNPDRLDTYLDRLAHLAATILAAEYAVFEDPGPTPAPALSTYAKVSARLKEENGVAIILLPAFLDAVANFGPGNSASNADHPVRHYMTFRRPRLIFFAESRHPGGVRSWHDGLDGDGSEEALILDLGPLDDDDVWTFADSRVKACEHPAVPTVKPELMKNFVPARGTTLSRLQQLCFHAWDRAISRKGTEVNGDDITWYYQERADGYARRPRRPRGDHHDH